MAIPLRKFVTLLQDPPPEFVFEISESGIAWARPASDAQPLWRALEPGVLNISPLADNVVKPDALADAIRSITGGASVRKRRAALVLPDFCARVAVLGFDNFPADPKEQMSLVRFRMKKSVPFDVEAAAVSYYAPSTKGAVDVVVVVAALEIVARYEAAFRAAGLHPGHVTTSAVAALELIPPAGVSVLARLNGRVLTVVVAAGPALKLVRTVELPELSADEILAVLFPTLAYIEDEMGTQPARLLLCGFGDTGSIAPEWVTELQTPVEPLRTPWGEPTGGNIGLLGYLQSLSPSGVRAA